VDETQSIHDDIQIQHFSRKTCWEETTLENQVSIGM
jgi:hypothetical protein